MSLSWDAVAGATGYKVKRSTTAGGPYAIIASEVTGTDYLDTDVTNGTTYYYVVSAVHTTGESANSNEASATPRADAPAAPENLQASAGDAQVSLSWDTVAEATGYKVKRYTTAGGPYDVIASEVTGTDYLDTDVTNGTTYYYVVSAVHTSGESANSNEASATPHANAPAAPENLQASAGDAQVSLSWTAVSGASSYTIKRATTAGGPYTEVATGVTDTTYVDTPLTNGITYYYVVSAVNQGGEGPNSNEASATPTAPQQGGRAILSIVLSNGMEREYDLTMTEVG
ncbi:MAG: fibronectin type III domain-containing protein [Ignavibacteriales bacterium]